MTCESRSEDAALTPESRWNAARSSTPRSVVLVCGYVKLKAIIMVPARSPPPRATIQTIIMLKSELSTRVEPGIKYSRSSWRLGERRKGKFCEFCWGECTRCTIIVINVRDVCRLVERAARFASPARPRGGARRADRARRQRGRGGRSCVPGRAGTKAERWVEHAGVVVER